MNARVAGLMSPYGMAETAEQAYTSVRTGMRQQALDEEARKRREALTARNAIRAEQPGELGLPAAGQGMMIPGLTPVAPGAAPITGMPVVSRPSAGRQPVSQATENQSLAETRRLAGKTTPETKLLEGGGGNYLREKARFDELKALNPPVPTPNESAAETQRLNRVGVPSTASPLTPEFFARQRMVESANNPNAVSPKGALGVMQTMPGTLRDPGFGVAPARDNSPAELQRVGEDYMRAMLNKFGNMRDALVAYNWGPGNAERWIAQGANVAALPAETQGYLQKLMGAAPQQTAQPAPQAAPQTAVAQQPAAAPQAATQSAPEPQLREFFSAAPFVEQGLQLARMRFEQVQRLLQVSRDESEMATLNEAAFNLRGQIFEGQLYGLAARAQGGDEQALNQLAQVAQAPYAVTDQGYVMVTIDPRSGQYVPTTRPMRPDELAHQMFQRASTAARQALAKSSSEIAVERAKQGFITERELMVKAMDGDIEARKILMNAERELQKLIATKALDANDYKELKFDDRGNAYVLTSRGVMKLNPPQELKPGLPALPTMTPVAIQ
jgi:hypothetical protein